MLTSASSQSHNWRKSRELIAIKMQISQVISSKSEYSSDQDGLKSKDGGHDSHDRNYDYTWNFDQGHKKSS